MIYDFGCATSSEITNRILPALASAFAVIVTMAGVTSIGAALNRRSSFHTIDIFSGWGVTAAFMTLVAVLFTHALSYAALVLAFIMLGTIFLAVKRGYFISSFWLLALFPGLVILTVINMSGIARWDDFSHWVPNALYLFQHDGLPSHAMPAPHSVLPSYPYALPFLTYLASQLANGFLVQGGAMINFLLLLAFAAILAEVRPPVVGTRPMNLRSVGLTGLTLLLVTLANPAFNASFTMTSQGDTSTMVLVGVLALLLWRMIDALQNKIGSDIKKLALQITLTGVAFILIKQVNIILLGLLIFAFLVVAWKNKILKPALKQLPLLLSFALLLHFVWRHYVNTELASAGFGVQPLAAWRFDLIGPILKAMMHEMTRKNGLFGLIVVIVICGVSSLFRPATPVRNFALFAAIVCGGYIAFLFTTYVGSTFSEAETRRAASFYRYSTHVGLLGITFLWIAAPSLWNQLKEKTHPSSIVLTPATRMGVVTLMVLILPVSLLIHTGWLVPQPSLETCEVRHLGDKVAQTLPDHARLAVVEPESDGFFGFIVNFELVLNEVRSGHAMTVAQDISTFNTDPIPTRLQETLSGQDIDAILIQKAAHTPFRILGFDNAQGPVLLLRNRQEWKRVVL